MTMQIIVESLVVIITTRSNMNIILTISKLQSSNEEVISIIRMAVITMAWRGKVIF